jgi:hypothetical protein
MRFTHRRPARRAQFSADELGPEPPCADRGRDRRRVLYTWVPAGGFFRALSFGIRSRIVLAAADGANNQEIAAKLKIPAVTVGKWRRLFAAHGIEGLRDAPRSGRPPKHDADVRRQVQTRVCQQPEDQSRWSVRTLAAELGLPASTMHAMLVAARLQPHRIRTFTFGPKP